MSRARRGLRERLIPLRGVENIDHHPDPAENQLDAVQRDAASQIVVAAIVALPERQRLAVILTHYQDLTNIESAEFMNISVDALESLVPACRGRGVVCGSV